MWTLRMSELFSNGVYHVIFTKMPSLQKGFPKWRRTERQYRPWWHNFETGDKVHQRWLWVGGEACEPLTAL